LFAQKIESEGSQASGARALSGEAVMCESARAPAASVAPESGFPTPEPSGEAARAFETAAASTRSETARFFICSPLLSDATQF
jgi:hypothetical protein